MSERTREVVPNEKSGREETEKFTVPDEAPVRESDSDVAKKVTNKTHFRESDSSADKKEPQEVLIHKSESGAEQNGIDVAQIREIEASAEKNERGDIQFLQGLRLHMTTAA